MTLISIGCYRLGKMSSDTWWESQAATRQAEAANQAMEFEKHFRWDLALAQEIHAGIYIGCGGTGTVYLGRTTIVLKKVDYGIYMDSCSGPVSLVGVSIHDSHIEMESKP